ncbi:DsbA family protein [Demequina sp. B12]|uniref:DsbA family protein n=1 Tax=Demequina sp. B12 TaxID=2992757 RepID=UPI00237B1E74|nr:thioredoxin domain-containing protein [Demequina sp. B12]MDE0572886.1 DsbA family protein [Demequina sp. B12]
MPSAGVSQSRTWWMIGGAVALVALTGCAVSQGSSEASDADASASASEPQVTPTGLPWGPNTAGAVTVGEDGSVALGDGSAWSGDTQTTSIDVYYDFACYYCMLFESTAAEDLADFAADPDVTVTYHPVAILDAKFPSAYSTRAAASAFVVAQTAPEIFATYNDALMMAQQSLPEDGWTEQQMAQLALDLGAPQETADAITGTAFESMVAEATQAALTGGMTGTPSVAVNGELIDHEQVNYLEPGALKEYVETR